MNRDTASVYSYSLYILLVANREDEGSSGWQPKLHFIKRLSQWKIVYLSIQMFHSRKCPKITIAIWPPSYMASMAVITMTSSNENIFRVTIAHCQGNPPVTGGFPSQRPAIGAKAGTRGRWHPFTWKYVWKDQSPRQHNGTWSTSPKMMQ